MSTLRSPHRRLLVAGAAAASCLAFAGCDAAAASTPRPPSSAPPTARAANSGQPGGTSGHDHGGAGRTTTAAAPTGAVDPTDAAPTTAPATGGTNGLDVLARDCTNSGLQPHTGFQIAPACVSTAFGEVADADRSPSLLITKAPRTVARGVPFTLSVSTRNLVRDRFLGAAAGGYYLESSLLNGDGIQRGHFHTACRMLPRTDQAPDSSPAPAFFVATQDGGGGSAPDTVEVRVTGLPDAGTAQCTVWAGDGSHRIPMMQRANQTPAVDSVRVTVR